ncbi:hypothetical protein GCWU000341_00839 [Oribacterium sp. oral taxon 078 str. F0262]|uniref:guanylate kinase n=1 Tax=Oribacterium sp. oral taxon 078 TaxID=652706 RepID=UPI0001BCBD21|nr:guanylate kinase [Oribacterium sp. oral taxon 078]EFE92320.1 hypothetical protein GCWU000341_00839 [Oribacterium sp. oral taxon 078 str. F0262]
MIYYLMGKSASGKDTICRALRKARPDWKLLIPYTTRPMRSGEREGAEYHFVSERELQRLRDAGKILEERSYETEFGIWRYASVDDGRIGRAGGGDYLLIGTLESYRKLRGRFGEGQLFPLYLELPEELRLERARRREEEQEKPSWAEFWRRFSLDEQDFSEEKLREAGIVRRYRNLEWEACVNEILADTAS